MKHVSMWKRIALILFSLVLCVGMTACGPTSGEGEPSSNDEPSTSESETSEPEKEPSGDVENGEETPDPSAPEETEPQKKPTGNSETGNGSSHSSQNETTGATSRTFIIFELDSSGSGVAEIIRDGKSMKPYVGMRLKDGDQLVTNGSMEVYMKADDDKTFCLGTGSTINVADFDDKNLSIELTKGSLFFNVEKPLQDDENLSFLNGSTAMTIRGTSGLLRVLEYNSHRMEVYLPSGHLGVDGDRAPSGGDDIYAYQYALVEEGRILTEHALTPETLPDDLLKQLARDPNLLTRYARDYAVKTGMNQNTAAAILKEEVEEYLHPDQKAPCGCLVSQVHKDGEAYHALLSCGHYACSKCGDGSYNNHGIFLNSPEARTLLEGKNPELFSEDIGFGRDVTFCSTHYYCGLSAFDQNELKPHVICEECGGEGGLGEGHRVCSSCREARECTSPEPFVTCSICGDVFCPSCASDMMSCEGCGQTICFGCAEGEADNHVICGDCDEYICTLSGGAHFCEYCYSTVCQNCYRGNHASTFECVACHEIVHSCVLGNHQSYCDAHSDWHCLMGTEVVMQCPNCTNFYCDDCAYGHYSCADPNCNKSVCQHTLEAQPWYCQYCDKRFCSEHYDRNIHELCARCKQPICTSPNGHDIDPDTGAVICTAAF